VIPEAQFSGWADETGHSIIDKLSADYPLLLNEIPGPPDRLYVDGRVDALHLPALAIVGSRNPTRQGRQTAYEFARHLGSAGFYIPEGYDFAATSFHILTSDGIRGRDTLAR